MPLFEDVLKRQQAKFGRQHPNTLQMVANLGVNYKDAGRLKEAIPLLEEAYRASRTFPNLRWVEVPLVDGYLEAGKLAEAIPVLEQMCATYEKQLGVEHRDTLTTRHRLAAVYWDAGKLPESIALF